MQPALESYGIKNVSHVYWNLSTPALYEEAVRRREGLMAHLGPLVVRTGHHTGRSPKDKFIVREASSEKKIWWGTVNRPFKPSRFAALYYRLLAYLQGKDIFIQDCYAGSDQRYRISLRIITETAWHGLFARNMFVQIKDLNRLEGFTPEFTLIHLPRFHALPELDGTNSEAFILVNFEKGLVLIGGTSYAGEIKKSIFTILNYLLPQKDILSMHCSANMGEEGVCLFFGLSGTGKTTLSTDPERRLIGDDEHGWSESGIFNLEGGCYAKVICLSKEAEPEIYECTRRFGTILENVSIDSNRRRIDLDDATLTENTRAAYPITHIQNSISTGIGDHPKNIIMLTCDAFGVLPPIAKLKPEQAIYHFLSGYTAKVAGTELDLKGEPEATFSPCFGAPFMALPPTVYAKLLAEKIAQHKVNCWLVNTGWSGGPFGVGERMKISYTRQLLREALKGALTKVPVEEEPIFGLCIPTSFKDFPREILNPRNTWRDTRAYDAKAKELASEFKRNFAQFEEEVSEAVKKSGPKG